MTNTSKRDSRTVIMRSKRNSARLGPMYVDPKHLEAGFHHLWVDIITPGVLDYYTTLGFTPVRGKLEVGDQTTATASQNGSCPLVKSKCGLQLMLMRITQETWDELETEQKSDNDSLYESIHNPNGIDKANLIGDIKIK